jgi:hypothetical protein
MPRAHLRGRASAAFELGDPSKLASCCLAALTVRSTAWRANRWWSINKCERKGQLTAMPCIGCCHPALECSKRPTGICWCHGAMSCHPVQERATLHFTYGKRNVAGGALKKKKFIPPSISHVDLPQLGHHHTRQRSLRWTKFLATPCGRPASLTRALKKSAVSRACPSPSVRVDIKLHFHTFDSLAGALPKVTALLWANEMPTMWRHSVVLHIMSRESSSRRGRDGHERPRGG